MIALNNKAKDRQDAWTEENDLLLADTVLRHVREGSTQLNAFEEVGDRLNRTSAACGFRWNAVVRHQYENALSLAKKYRKERARTVGAERAKKKLLYTPPTPHLEETLQHLVEIAPEVNVDVSYTDIPLPFEPPFDETYSMTETLLEQEVNTEPDEQNTTETPEMRPQPEVRPQPQMAFYQAPVSRNSAVSVADCIRYLQTFMHHESQYVTLQRENERLRREIHGLKTRNMELEQSVHRLENSSHMIQEDYETLIKIMNRARKLVVLEEDEETEAPSFRMDRNGNLERIAE
ncbi:MAG: RsfA family transcriptional regulator [Bacilli bacterium]